MVYFIDDSYFYLKTAQNFALGYGSTFDRVNLTNGYHPLWLFLLSGYYLLTSLLLSATPENFLRAVCILHLIIYLVTVFTVKTIWDTIKPNQNNFMVVIIFGVFSLLLIYLRDFGFEAHIACLIIAVYIFIKAKEIFKSESHPLLKSILLVLLSLARVDYIYQIIPAIILFEFLFTPKDKKIKLVLLLILPLMSVLIIYYYINLTYFGNIQTTPSYLRNNFPRILLMQNIPELFQRKSYNQIVKLSFFFISLIFFGFRVGSEHKNSKEHRFDLFLLFLSLGAMLFCLMHLSFNKAGIMVWYVTVPAFISILLFLRVIQNRLNHFFLLFVMLMIVLILYFYYFRIKDPDSRVSFNYDYAKKLNEITDVNDRIFQFDICGIVGYFSERNIINGDGLANSFEYIHYYENKNLDGFFKNKNVGFYSMHSESGFDFQLKNFNNTDYFIDTVNSNYSGYNFIFSKDNLVLKLEDIKKYNHENAVTKWYLFKFDNAGSDTIR